MGSRHCDGDGLRYAGPEHRRCNRATARHRKARELRLERESAEVARVVNPTLDPRGPRDLAHAAFQVFSPGSL